MDNRATRRLVFEAVSTKAGNPTFFWDSQLSWAAISVSLKDMIAEIGGELDDGHLETLIAAAAMAQRHAMTPPIDLMPLEVVHD